jgi:predicted XRE-type DNA-binding protein
MFDNKVPIRLEVTHEMLNDLARRGLNEADILAVVTGKFDSDMHFARIAELIERDARPST